MSGELHGRSKVETPIVVKVIYAPSPDARAHLVDVLLELLAIRGRSGRR